MLFLPPLFLATATTLLLPLHANPVPQEDGDEPVLDPAAVNASEDYPTDLAPDSLVDSGNGTFTIESRLTFPSGSKCDGNQQKAARQAFADALTLAMAVGPPELVLGWKPGDDTPKGRAPVDYYGVQDDWPDISLYVSGNWRRAQLPNKQNWPGDWWNGRYFEIRCDDKISGCTAGVRAYELEPKTDDNPSEYPVINLCTVDPTPFFKLETWKKQIENIDKGLLPKDDVRSMTSQGSAFLHEMFHAYAKSFAGGQGPGISQPRCQDKVMRGSKAYGPEKAKYLARNTAAGAQAAMLNNDNYIYYAISQFMMKKWSVPYPSKPKYAWPNTASTDSEDFWDTIDDNADLNELEDGPLIEDDAEFYGNATDDSGEDNSPETDLRCSNPSLEDGDGICTCTQGAFVTTITPEGGAGNKCPETLTDVPASASSLLTATSSEQPAATTTAPPEEKEWGCSNPSLEDGDGICTCTTGTVTTTITPEGGPGNTCPTSL